MSLAAFLPDLVEGRSLTAERMGAAVGAIMAGEASEAEIGAFLALVRLRGETSAELVGAVEALRLAMTPLPDLKVDGLTDTCGTGGDGSGTFNVSTATAFVVAGAGVPVAKHGNRAASSRSGSADVLGELGVDLACPPERVADCLRENGVAFFFAPVWHPAMKVVASIRKRLGFRTLFNLVGPLANPTRASNQLIGVGRREWMPVLAQSATDLGVKNVLVAHGEDGLDEVTLSGRTLVVFVRGGEKREATWSPDDFGLPASNLSEYQASGPAESAAIIKGVLNGEPGPCRDLVVANAAATLWIAGRAGSLPEGVELAAQAIDSGAAKAKLDAVRRASMSL